MSSGRPVSYDSIQGNTYTCCTSFFFLNGSGSKIRQLLEKTDETNDNLLLDNEIKHKLRALVMDQQRED